MVKLKTNDNFYYGASGEIMNRARVLRKTMTYSEIRLWDKLKNKQFHDLTFRRQHPVSKFIVDFYCHASKLVIEVDGDVHLEEIQHERDKGRTFEIEEFGLTVIRFTNNMVNTDITKVLNEIEKYILD